MFYIVLIIEIQQPIARLHRRSTNGRLSVAGGERRDEEMSGKYKKMNAMRNLLKGSDAKRSKKNKINLEFYSGC